MEDIIYVYLFCNLSKMLKIRLASRNKVAVLSTSEPHIWEPFCTRIEWNPGWKKEPPKHSHDHLLKGTVDEHISWGLPVGDQAGRVVISS